MSAEGLNALRARVNDDVELAQHLRAIEPEQFAAEASRVAAELGIDVVPAELERAAVQGRQAWTLRWIL